MTFARILESNAMLAGAQVVTLAAAFIRSKVIAVVLGPAGIGLVGVMSAFNGNVSALAAWGLGTSGVRLIASAEGTERQRKQAAVRRFGVILSATGLALSLALFWPITILTFREDGYAAELLIAGLAVPCLIGATAWSSLLQADGQVKSLAFLQMAAAVIGLLVGTPIIYFFGTMGIAWSILLAAALPAIATWWVASRRCPASSAVVMPDDIKAMVRLGGGLVFVGLASQVAAYVVRLIVIRHYEGLGEEGLTAAGYYQAAIAIAGSLPAAVFGAMGTDFFPRVAAAKNEDEAQSLVEKQIHAGLLLSLPLLTALLTMGSMGLRVLYDDRFEPAVPLLAWMIWGVFLRLLAWPLGYWMLARGSLSTVVIVETGSSLSMVALPLLLVPQFGVVGAAYAYAISYVIYSIVMLGVAHRRTGKWLSWETLGWFGVAAIWLCSTQIACHFAGGGWWGLVPTIAATIVCVALYYREVRQERES
jgi:PST family polysaccharide transporter